MEEKGGSELGVGEWMYGWRVEVKGQAGLGRMVLSLRAKSVKRNSFVSRVEHALLDFRCCTRKHEGRLSREDFSCVVR